VILILEDDDALKEILSLCLDSLDAKYKVSSSCEEAIDFMRSNEPLLLLADMRLTKEDSTEAIAYCRSHYKNCHTVLFTAMPKKLAKEVADKLHMDDVLLKPFEMDQLFSLINCTKSVTAQRT